MNDYLGNEIAIIGMACRLPGAQNPAEYWNNLRDGVESIRPYTDDELRRAGVSEKLIHHPSYVKAGAPVDGMALFDPNFFNMRPREALVMDPQHRHFLACAWEALENGGIDPTRFDGSIGVFGGSGHNLYYPMNVLTNQSLVDSEGLFLLRHTGNDKDFLTTRVSYTFNLKGPSVNVQTACSTSLVALHMAVQSLNQMECDMALVGGVTLEMPHNRGYLYQENEILSPDGHCRAFDAASQGTVFGSGAGVVLVRRLYDAIKNNDPIQAIILGSAVNNDGIDKASYLAPSPEGQMLVIAEALEMADVSAESIGYVETHGTGTPLGDPIEMQALTQAYRQETDKTGYCAIGSAKTNIGHLDTAAGVAGLIKTVQALRHAEIPASLHFKQPNPMIDFEHSPFFVNAERREWAPSDKHPRRAGVSSLGVGGTNAHVVLQEAPTRPMSDAPQRAMSLLTLSAVSPGALVGNRTALAKHLKDNPELNLADAAYTLQLGRKAFKQRQVVVGRDREELIHALEATPRHSVVTQTAADAPPELTFMFPGGGAQYPNMGRDLYETEPIYRGGVDHCLALLENRCQIDFREILFPNIENLESARKALKRPSNSLPAVFITEYALAMLWKSWGVEPQAMIGHSMGEYTAACLAGVMSLADALSIVRLRGELFETLPVGGMISIPLPEDEIQQLLSKIRDEGQEMRERLSIGVINNAEACVVSGEIDAIDALGVRLNQQGISFNRIQIEVAAHSPMLDPILEPFENHMGTVTLNEPTIRFISNVSGKWITAEEATDPAYWVRHLRQPVRFADGLTTLLEREANDQILLEVGPGQTLMGLVRSHPATQRHHIPAASMRHFREKTADDQQMLLTLGNLWACGVEIDWSKFYGGEKRNRIHLPTYAFDTQEYWLEPGRELYTAEPSATDNLTKVADINEWFYTSDWRNDRQRLTQPGPLPQETWLVFADEVGLSELIRASLIGDKQTVITVTAGDHFEQLNQQGFVIRPHQQSDYVQLLQALTAQGMLPDRMLHMWTVYRAEGTFSIKKAFLKSQMYGFGSLVNFAQAWGELDNEHPLHMAVITNGTQIIGQEDACCVEKSTLLGPCKVIPREYPHINCQLIDVTLPQNTQSQSWFFKQNGADGEVVQTELVRIGQQLTDELTARTPDPLLAYRDTGRWVAEVAPCPPTDLRPTESISHLRKNGVYLITGGLGGIGLTLAQHLAEEWQAKLILLSRSSLPPRNEWENWLESHSPNNRTSQTILKVQRMEAAGGDVMVLSTDVTDRKQVQQAVTIGKKRFGAIHGVIHGAGVIDDDLIQMKDLAAADKVMRPKVIGTFNLYQAVQAYQLDFVMLFSSTSTVLAPQGQVDYVGANAFLNSFAQQHNKNQNSNIGAVIALNWGVWQEVGMAAATSRGEQAPLHGQPTRHPLLGQIVSAASQKIEFMADYRTDELWVLDQHRIRQGAALIPGTGYLEMAAAAIQATSNKIGTIQIRDLFFLSPLTVQDETSQRVTISLESHEYGHEYAFQVTGRQGRQVTEHARGTVSLIQDKPQVPKLDLEMVWARCTKEHVQYTPATQRTRQEKYLDFGQRWKNLRDVWLGENESIAYLSLLPRFAADVNEFCLHPALLDLATTHGLPLLDGYAQDDGLYVPFSYHSLKSYAPVPDRIFSHVQLKSQSNRSMPVFDVTLTSDRGEILVEIEGFSMKRVTHAEMVALQAVPEQTNQAVQDETWLQKTIKAGIRPEEGIEVFNKVLSHQVPAQMIASSIRLEALAHALDENTSQTSSNQIDVERPNHLGNDYARPRNEVESALVDLWQDLIGVRPIGIDDDFFELGGHSLIAVRLFTRIRKLYDVDLSLATLFETPTIGQCAERIMAELGIETTATGTVEITEGSGPLHKWSPLVMINQGEDDQIPFFCVHGAGGNVLNFQKLSQHMGSDRPFYGLQAQGVDGGLPALTSIEEMAALYLEAIRRVWPDGPFLLGGYSGGGVVAYEIAQTLKAAGEPVPLVVFMDSFHPKIESQRIPVGEHWRQMLKWGPGYLRERLKQKEAKKSEAQKTADALHWVANHPRQTIPMEFREPYVVHHFLNALRQYKPQPYSGRVVQFTASETWIVYQHVGADRGWADLIPNLELLTTPGDHDHLFVEPNVHILGSQLQNVLDGVEEKMSSKIIR